MAVNWWVTFRQIPPFYFTPSPATFAPAFDRFQWSLWSTLPGAVEIIKSNYNFMASWGNAVLCHVFRQCTINKPYFPTARDKRKANGGKFNNALLANPEGHLHNASSRQTG